MRESILTPYKATEIMNAHRRELGLKEVNSPMLYIQANKGKFSITYHTDGRKMIADIDEFLLWVVTHNMRQVARKVTVNEETRVRELLELTMGDDESHDEKTIDGIYK